MNCSGSCWRKSTARRTKPLVRQHLGRSYFASGNIAAAVESFARALDLRVAGSADAALIYASTVALQRARDVLDLAS